jgi:uncharacterized membrane-anchored protein
MKPGKKQKIIFMVAVLALLSIPLYLILRSESMLADTDHLYKFKPVRMVDPHDPLRGNYLVLNFPQQVEVDSNEHFSSGKNNIYVTVERDSLGYAHFNHGYKNKPQSPNYFTASTRFSRWDARHVWIEVPFDKYFIKESNAQLAEKVYLREMSDSNTNMYLEVSIRDGESLLKDVYIDSIPLSEYMNKLTAAQRQELDTAVFTRRRGLFR